MTFRYALPALALALASCHLAAAQDAGAALKPPANAPAGATGMCKDGSFSTNATKSGACSGHKGVAQWYAAVPGKPAGAASAPSSAQKASNTGATPAAPARVAPKSSAPAPATAPAPVQPAPAAAAPRATPAPAAAPRSVPAPASTPAPGGGPGMVWVNLSTKIYHCPGDRYYGKTKDGKYMTEADAQKAGARGERNQVCFK